MILCLSLKCFHSFWCLLLSLDVNKGVVPPKLPQLLRYATLERGEFSKETLVNQITSTQEYEE